MDRLPHYWDAVDDMDEVAELTRAISPAPIEQPLGLSPLDQRTAAYETTRKLKQEQSKGLSSSPDANGKLPCILD